MELTTTKTEIIFDTTALRPGDAVHLTQTKANGTVMYSGNAIVLSVHEHHIDLVYMREDAGCYMHLNPKEAAAGCYNIRRLE